MLFEIMPGDTVILSHRYFLDTNRPLPTLAPKQFTVQTIVFYDNQEILKLDGAGGNLWRVWADHV